MPQYDLPYRYDGRQHPQDGENAVYDERLGRLRYKRLDGYVERELISPSISDQRFLFYTPTEVVVEEINSVVVGSSTPSCSWDILYAATRDSGSPTVASSEVTNSEASGNKTFPAVTIPAGNWVWLSVTGSSGTVNDVHISIRYSYV